MSDKSIQPQDKYVLRLPDGMRDRLRVEAERNGRSMNSEIIARLEQTLVETIDSNGFIKFLNEYKIMSNRLNDVLALTQHLTEDEVFDLIKRKEIVEQYNAASPKKKASKRNGPLKSS